MLVNGVFKPFYLRKIPNQTFGGGSKNARNVREPVPDFIAKVCGPALHYTDFVLPGVSGCWRRQTLLSKEKEGERIILLDTPNCLHPHSAFLIWGL